MKATGIARRIDALGRIVILKEIRHTIFIREGASFGIHIVKKENAFAFSKKGTNCQGFALKPTKGHFWKSALLNPSKLYITASVYPL